VKALPSYKGISMEITDKMKVFLEEHGGQGTKEIPEEIMTEFLDGCKSAFESVFVKSEFKFPRPSSLNHGGRKMYYMKNEPELFTGEKLPYNLRNTFFQGHMLEAYFIAVAKMSGIKFDAVQKYTEWETTSGTVGGTLDYIIDGQVWDAKTANDRAYISKWKNVDTLESQDSYGYIRQGTVYSNAEQLPFAGWHVINKNTGVWKTIKADNIDFVGEANALEHSLEQAFGEEIPPVCHNPIAEVYRPRGKKPIVTGNKHLTTTCTNCPVRKAGKCSPAPIVAVGKRSSGNEVLYTEWNNDANPNIKVKICGN